ncbi:MAG: EFR1 family ferrodoxin [Chitinispirillaceae bacterium]|nr:EFR1 family ferrodoxin [Chitinispirillaceae bacterium]
MSKPQIFYLSGTGNSLAAARRIAQGSGGSVRSICSLREKGVIDTKSDTIGFVFPVYDFKPPPLCIDFIQRIKNISSSYIFAVCTYGIAPYKTLYHFKNALSSCNATLSAGFTIKMPVNAIGSSKIGEREIRHNRDDCITKTNQISEIVNQRKKIPIESTSLLKTIFNSRFITLFPTLIQFLTLITTKGSETLNFKSNKRCNGCRVCERVCPVENIQIVKKRPIWLDHCINCFACYNWCPVNAITTGNYQLNTRQYHHPDIRLSDMIQR